MNSDSSLASSSAENWSIQLKESNLSHGAKMLDLLENNINSPELPSLLEEFLAQYIVNKSQINLIIGGILDDSNYRNRFIESIRSSIENYSLKFQNLPTEIIWQILSNLDIVSLRAINNSSEFMKETMNDIRFVKILCSKHKIDCDEFLSDPNEVDKNTFDWFAEWAGHYSNYYYDSDFCDTQDLNKLSHCIIIAIKNNLPDKVIELRIKSHEILSNPPNYGILNNRNILPVILQHYRPEYNISIVYFFDGAIRNNPNILNYLKSEDFDKVPYTIILDMYYRLISNNISSYDFYKLVINSLIRTNRINDWSDFVDINNMMPNDNLHENVIIDSLMAAIDYDRIEHVRLITNRNFPNIRIIDQLYYTYPCLSDDSLLREFVNVEDDTLRFLMFDGALKTILQGLNILKSNKNNIELELGQYKIEYGRRNINIILQEFDRRQIWSELFSLEPGENNQGGAMTVEKSNTFYRILLIFIAPIFVLDYVLPDIIALLTKTQKRELNNMLLYMYTDKLQMMIDNIESAKKLYKYLRSDVLGVKFDFKQLMPLLYKYNPPFYAKNDQYILYANYIDWLSTLPGFELGLLKFDYFKQIRVAKTIFKYINDFNYSFNLSKNTITTISAPRNPGNERKHQTVLKLMYRSAILGDDYEFINNILERIRVRRGLKRAFFSKLKITESEYLKMNRLLMIGTSDFNSSDFNSSESDNFDESSLAASSS